ncbi:hypothetical protein [Moorena producens]|uniref:hypothetical protein n=1 Tax=Moorena producens TaxID=1155739 RepID=UPI0011EA6879|nr:hypothetical protein [Moorena producens]
MRCTHSGSGNWESGIGKKSCLYEILQQYKKNLITAVITINFSTESDKYHHCSLFPVPCSLFPVPFNPIFITQIKTI